ncbi:MAG: response regulator transcription factor [Armatimonadota bacterium]|nr:response regulator transcription factor [Armatimonadota bacterium]
MARVLVIGSDERTLAAIAAAVCGLNHFVAVAWDEESLADALAKGSPEAVVLDIRGGGGLLEQLKRLLSPYEQACEAPRLAVADRDHTQELYSAYVSDFIFYPFETEELAIRLTRLLSRGQLSRKGKVIEARGLVIDLESFEVSVDGRQLTLTFKEFELLRFLASHPGRVYTRQALLNHVWGYEYFGGLRTVDVHIRRLRGKLGPRHEDLIQTVHGVGYKFVP